MVRQGSARLGKARQARYVKFRLVSVRYGEAGMVR